MKRILILLTMVWMFLWTANAFALTPYSSTFSFGTNGYKVNLNTLVPMSFSGLTATLLDASLVFDVAAVTDGRFKINGVKNFGTVDAAKGLVAAGGFHKGSNTFSSADESLDLVALNNSISNGKLNLYFTQLVGSTTIRSATLSGTMAPEPVSMALVGAGLAGLPFARRFRNKLQR